LDACFQSFLPRLCVVTRDGVTPDRNLAFRSMTVFSALIIVFRLCMSALGTLASPAMWYWGTCPLDLPQFNFLQCTVIYTKSDSDYKLRFALCKHPVTFVPLLAQNPGDATGWADVLHDWIALVASFCMQLFFRHIS